MEALAVERAAGGCKGACCDEEYDSHSWLEDYIERLEGKAARQEFLDSYEYHSLIATLFA